MNKYNVAQMLSEISAYEKGFKKKSFENASMLILGMSDEQFNSIDPDHFDSVHGIGPSIAKCISEYNATGTMTRLVEHQNSGVVPTSHYLG